MSTAGSSGICCDGQPFPKQFKIVFSGVSDQDCDPCGDFNSTDLILDQQPASGGCGLYDATPSFACGGNTIQLTFQQVADQKFDATLNIDFAVGSVSFEATGLSDPSATIDSFVKGDDDQTECDFGSATVKAISIPWPASDVADAPCIPDFDTPATCDTTCPEERNKAALPVEPDVYGSGLCGEGGGCETAGCSDDPVKQTPGYHSLDQVNAAVQSVLPRSAIGPFQVSLKTGSARVCLGPPAAGIWDGQPRLSFRSHGAAASDFGRGFIDRYAAAITDVDGSSADLKTGTGETIRFHSKDANGDYQSPPGYQGTLKENTGGGWTLTQSNRNKTEFSTLR